MLGSISIPTGIFWFAWTNSPPIHRLLSIAAQILFDFGFVLILTSVQEYLSQQIRCPSCHYASSQYGPSIRLQGTILSISKRMGLRSPR